MREGEGKECQRVANGRMREGVKQDEHMSHDVAEWGDGDDQ